jgi:enoyl-CoA hydratase/carnithine racemase
MEVERLGLVNEVVPKQMVYDRAVKLADQLAMRPQLFSANSSFSALAAYRPRPKERQYSHLCAPYGFGRILMWDWDRGHD